MSILICLVFLKKIDINIHLACFVIFFINHVYLTIENMFTNT